jgi:hypothetical protein
MSQHENAEHCYSVEIREQGQRVSLLPIADPFINTTIKPQGWRVAWAVLRRRYEVSVHVGGDRQRTNEVMKLNHQRPVWSDDIDERVLAHLPRGRTLMSRIDSPLGPDVAGAKERLLACIEHLRRIVDYDYPPDSVEAHLRGVSAAARSYRTVFLLAQKSGRGERS